jgi:hypothetical protein
VVRDVRERTRVEPDLCSGGCDEDEGEKDHERHRVRRNGEKILIHDEDELNEHSDERREHELIEVARSEPETGAERGENRSHTRPCAKLFLFVAHRHDTINDDLYESSNRICADVDHEPVQRSLPFRSRIPHQTPQARTAHRRLQHRSETGERAV